MITHLLGLARQIRAARSLSRELVNPGTLSDERTSVVSGRSGLNGPSLVRGSPPIRFGNARASEQLVSQSRSRLRTRALYSYESMPSLDCGAQRGGDTMAHHGALRTSEPGAFGADTCGRHRCRRGAERRARRLVSLGVSAGTLRQMAWVDRNKLPPAAPEYMPAAWRTRVGRVSPALGHTPAWPRARPLWAQKSKSRTQATL